MKHEGRIRPGNPFGNHADWLEYFFKRYKEYGSSAATVCEEEEERTDMIATLLIP